MSNPLVSVIIPVYNVEQYIEKTVTSVIDQNYDNIEVIIVDDGSRDASILIAQNCLKNSKRNYKIIAQKNKGLAGARNTGIDYAAGAYVCFIDADDIISVNHIRNSVEALEQYDCGVSYSDFEYTKENTRFGKEDYLRGANYLSRMELLFLFSKREIRIHCCSLMISRKILIYTDLRFNERLRFGEDVEFMARLFSSVRGIVHIKQNSYKYLIRKGSIMNSVTVRNWRDFMIEFQATIMHLQEKHNELMELFDVLYCRTILGVCRIIAKNADFNTYKLLTEGIKKKDIKIVLYRACDWKVRMMASIIKCDKLFYMANHHILFK